MLWSDIGRLALAPLFVAVVTLIGRRLGPSAAGMLAALPVLAGSILGLLVAAHGSAFGSVAAFGSALGVTPTVIFAWVFARVAPRWSTAGCLALAYLAYFLAASTMLPIPIQAISAVSVPGIVWLGVMRTFPSHGGPTEAPRVLAWDIPVRMLVTLGLVALVMWLARWVGPSIAGLLAPFPVVTAVVAAFSHAQAGPRTAALVLRALVRGIPSFVSFFVVVGAMLPHASAPLAFAAGTLACLACHALLLRTGIGAAPLRPDQRQADTRR